MSKEILIFKNNSGNTPFLTWLNKLNKIIRARILARIDRIKLGHYGDYKRLRNGVSELRINTGAGYRIYFAEYNDRIVVLLAGGTKSTQKRDIEKAIKYFADFQERYKYDK